MKKIFLIFTGILSGILIIELTLSFFPSYSFESLATGIYSCKEERPQNFCYRSSKLLGYELIPNATKRINSFGMRDKEYTLIKPINTFRILLLGDSIVAQIGSLSKWADYIENRLNTLGNFEVLNCGVSGYNLYHYWKYLKHKGSKFQPDLVLVTFCLNDIVSWNCVRTILLDKKKKMYIYFSVKSKAGCVVIEPTLKINPWLFKKSYLYRFFTVKFMNIIFQKDVVNPNEEPLRMLQQMKQLSGNNIIGIVFPYFKPLEQYNSFELNEYETTLDVLKKTGITYLDLHPYFSKFGENITKFRLNPEDKIHFTDECSIILSEIIYPWLKEKIDEYNDN